MMMIKDGVSDMRDIHPNLSVIDTKKTTYNKDLKEFSAEISDFLEEVDYGSGLKGTVVTKQFFNPIFANSNDVVGFRLKSHKTETEILMKFFATIRENGTSGDIIYWEFVPLFKEDRALFTKFILFND